MMKQTKLCQLRLNKSRYFRGNRRTGPEEKKKKKESLCQTTLDIEEQKLKRRGKIKGRVTSEGQALTKKCKRCQTRIRQISSAN